MNKKYPLWLYVIGVVIVLAIINCIARFVGGEAKFGAIEIFSLGFLMGMLAMYVAVHVYKWK
jgi:hypothetical protein